MSNRRGGPLIRSVRTRLALWHTGVLALVLVAFVSATWAFLDRVTRQRIDHSLEEAVGAFQQAVQHSLRSGIAPEDAARLAAGEFRFSERRVLVYGARHRLLAVSDSTRDILTAAISAVEEADDSPLHPLFASLVPGSAGFATVGEGAQQVRGYARSILVGNEPLTIVALQLGLSERTILATFLQAVGIATLLALVAAGAGGYFLASRSFQPVLTMGREASSIDSEHLGKRLVVRETGDEMDELATVFNDMLDRLERSFHQQQQFMADASHELRTPIASLRAAASIALSQSRSAEEYHGTLMHVRSEARRLSAVVDDLFTLARLDAEDHALLHETFFLEEVALSAVEGIRPLAEERQVSIQFTPAVEARCAGDASLIERVLTNLLDNAIKHTTAGGVVRVELSALDARHEVRVIDDGEGIPIEAQARVFDRFFRADASRTRSGDAPRGAGLGLSIAKRIVQAHGGELVLASSRPGATEFTFWLPRSTR